MDSKFFMHTLSALHKQIKYLRLNGFPGLCQDFTSHSESNAYPLWCDEMKHDIRVEESYKYEELVVTLPYAGTNFTIKLYFNLCEPWNSPDILFTDSKFLKKLKIEDLEEMVPCLNEWNYLLDDMLAQLFIQIHKLYKKYQLECLEEEELLHFEYQSLLKTLGIGEEDVEVSLSGGSGWVMSMMIRLPLSLKNIPPALINANPGTPTCLIHISLKRNSKTITPKLYVSPQVESLIGNSESIGLPVVPAASSVSDYSLTVFRLLENRVKTTFLNFEMRKQFVAQLLCHYGTATLEYDAEKFSKVAFLFDYKNFNFLLRIQVPEDFPNEPPVMTVHSIYHFNSKGTLHKTIQDFDYPSNSTPETIVEAMHESLIKILPAFQSYSVNNK